VFKRVISYLSDNSDKIIKVAQLCALLWVCFELHSLNQNIYNIYSGPGQFDAEVGALGKIADKLDDLKRTFLYR